MKWYNSIFTKVTILFAFALVGLGAFSFYSIQTQSANEHLELQRKYNQFIITINQIIRYGGDIALIEEYLKELNFKIVNNPKIQQDLLAELNPDINGITAKFLHDNDIIYILVQTPQKITLYRDSFHESLHNSYILTFVAFCVVLFLYILIIKALIPLRSLRKAVQYFDQDHINVSCIVAQNDEIGELSLEFDNAIRKIEALNQSRQLFLRAIMHELKTPITKGRIVAEMIENTIQKERLISVFKRLNFLIDDFAKIEEMSSNNYHLSKDTYPFAQILQRVFDNLLIDTTTRDFPIVCPDISVDVYVDFNIFCLAIKNLIDNALKYKTHGKVIIHIEDDQIAIKNLAPPFPRPIDEYFLPFFKNDKNPQSQGLGLGLYIIKNTIERQGLQLLYAYEEGYHIFRIKGAIRNNET